MKANEIIRIIENVCPEELAYPWDNVGLLCGDDEKEVKKILVTLDTNINTVKEAVEKGADMIVSHHPILLGGIKRIDYKTPTGQMLKLLIENNITLFVFSFLLLSGANPPIHIFYYYPVNSLFLF